MYNVLKFRKNMVKLCQKINLQEPQPQRNRKLQYESELIEI